MSLDNGFHGQTARFLRAIERMDPQVVALLVSFEPDVRRQGLELARVVAPSTRCLKACRWLSRRIAKNSSILWRARLLFFKRGRSRLEKYKEHTRAAFVVLIRANADRQEAA